MKRILLLLVTLMSSSVYAENMFNDLSKINETCISSSGRSIYDISLKNEIFSIGEIRYRFVKQDIFYEARVLRKRGNKLMGIADFLESRTGETSANSWLFTYDMENKILTDNDNIEAKCK